MVSITMWSFSKSLSDAQLQGSATMTMCIQDRLKFLPGLIYLALDEKNSPNFFPVSVCLVKGRKSQPRLDSILQDTNVDLKAASSQLNKKCRYLVIHVLREVVVVGRTGYLWHVCFSQQCRRVKRLLCSLFGT